MKVSEPQPLPFPRRLGCLVRSCANHLRWRFRQDCRRNYSCGIARSGSKHSPCPSEKTRLPRENRSSLGSYKPQTAHFRFTMPGLAPNVNRFIDIWLPRCRWRPRAEPSPSTSWVRPGALLVSNLDIEAACPALAARRAHCRPRLGCPGAPWAKPPGQLSRGWAPCPLRRAEAVETGGAFRPVWIAEIGRAAGQSVRAHWCPNGVS